MTGMVLALLLAPIPGGWTVRRSDGRELARYVGIGARRRALRFIRRHAR